MVTRLLTTSIKAFKSYPHLLSPALVASLVTLLVLGRKSTTRMGKVGAEVVEFGVNTAGALVLVGVVGGEMVGELLVGDANATTVGVTVGNALVGCVVARKVGVLVLGARVVDVVGASVETAGIFSTVKFVGADVAVSFLVVPSAFGSVAVSLEVLVVGTVGVVLLLIGGVGRISKGTVTHSPGIPTQ